MDRIILSDAAKRIGSTVQVLEIKQQGRISLKDRIAYFLRTLLERSPMSGRSGEPFVTYSMGYVLAEEYTDLAHEPLTAAQRLNGQHFIEATTAVVEDLARAGNVVIAGRGSTMILQDVPGVLHVGLVAPVELRIETIVRREHLDRDEAEKYTTEMEKARAGYFKKFFNVNPQDPRLYHLVLNMGNMRINTAAVIVAHAAGDFSPAPNVEAVVV